VEQGYEWRKYAAIMGSQPHRNNILVDNYVDILMLPCTRIDQLLPVGPWQFYNKGSVFLPAGWPLAIPETILPILMVHNTSMATVMKIYFGD